MSSPSSHRGGYEWPYVALVEEAKEIVKAVEEGKAVVVCCPGSYRGELLRRVGQLLKKQTPLYLYKELRDRLGNIPRFQLLDGPEAKPGIYVPYSYAEAAELRIELEEKLGKDAVHFVHLPRKLAERLKNLRPEERVQYPEGAAYCWKLKNLGKEAPGVLQLLEDYRDDLWRRIEKFLKNLGRELAKEYSKKLLFAFVSTAGLPTELAAAALNAARKTFGGVDDYFRGVVETLRLLKAVGERELDDVECVVDDLAALWGLETKELYKLARALTPQIEERVSELERQMKAAKAVQDILRQYRGGVVHTAPYELGIETGEGQLALGTTLSEGVPMAKFNGTARIYAKGQVVEESGDLLKILAETWKEVVKKEGVMIIRGPRGIGKSTLARALLATWLSEKPGRMVVEVEEPPNRPLKFDAELAFLFDPSPPLIYEGIERVDLTASMHEVAAAVLKNIDLFRGPRLVVLPDELYNTLKDDREVNERLGKLEGELHLVEVDLHNVEFLTEVVRAYSQCGGGDAAKEIGHAASAYREGYTLVAKLAGEWLRGQNCELRDVKSAVEEAGGRAKDFIAAYIAKVIFKGDSSIISNYALPILLHVYLGETPPEWPKRLKTNSIDKIYRRDTPQWAETLLKTCSDTKDPPDTHIETWLSKKHEDLIEETLKDLIEDKGKYAQHFTQIRQFKKQLTTGKSARETLAQIVFQVLERILPHRDSAVLARHIGAAVAGSPCAPLDGEAEDLKQWLYSGEKMPQSVLLVLAYAAAYMRKSLLKTGEPCRRLKELSRKTAERGGYSGVDVFEALGYVQEALATGEKCLEEVFKWLARGCIKFPLSEGRIHKRLGRWALKSWAEADYAADAARALNYLYTIADVALRGAAEYASEVLRRGLAKTPLEKLLLARVLALDESKVDEALEVVREICQEDENYCHLAKVLVYPHAAARRASLGYVEEAKRLVEEAISALGHIDFLSEEELLSAFRDYFDFVYVKPSAEKVAKRRTKMRGFVLHQAAITYKGIDLDVAYKYAEEACRHAEKPNDVVARCGLVSRILAIKGELRQAAEKEIELWNKAKEELPRITPKMAFAAFARYVVSLLYMDRRREAEEALRKYSWLADYYASVNPAFVALFYAVTSLYDKSHLQKAQELHVIAVLLRNLTEAARHNPVAAALLIAFAGHEEVCAAIFGDEASLCVELLFASQKNKIELLLNAAKRYPGLYALVNTLIGETAVRDVKEALYLVGASSHPYVSLAGSVLYMSEGRLDVAKWLAAMWSVEHVEKLVEKYPDAGWLMEHKQRLAQTPVLSSLFGDLAKALEDLQRCREALRQCIEEEERMRLAVFKLFFFYV